MMLMPSFISETKTGKLSSLEFIQIEHHHKQLKLLRQQIEKAIMGE